MKVALCVGLLLLVSVYGADVPGAKKTGGEPTKTAEIKQEKPVTVVKAEGEKPTKAAAIEQKEPVKVAEEKGVNPTKAALIEPEKLVEVIEGEPAKAAYVEPEELVGVVEEKSLDFTPSHVFVFIVPGGTNECMYETIEIDEPTDVSGAFFVSRGGRMTIRVTVHDELKNRLYVSRIITEGKFSLKITNSGTYKFCFDNSFDQKVPKQVVFAVDIEPGVSIEEMLKKDHLEPTKDTIRRLTRQSRLLKQGVKFMGMRLATQAKVQAATSNQVLWFTVLESLVVLVVTFGQVYYIQDLMNHRKTRV